MARSEGAAPRPVVQIAYCATAGCPFYVEVKRGSRWEAGLYIWLHKTLRRHQG